MSERLDKIEKIMEQMNIDASIRLEEDKERRKKESDERRKESNERKKEEDKRRKEEDERRKEEANERKKEEANERKKEEDKRRKEEDERRKEEANEREKAKKEFDKNFKEMVKESNKRGKKINNLEKIMDGIGLTQGDISEEIIADNFKNVFTKIGENISSIERNLTIYTKGRNKRIIGEFDIIGVNGSKIFIGETKTKLTKDHIDKMINTTIPNFKKYDNRHDGMKVYGVVGARVFANRWVIPYAIKHGLYIIKETHKGNAEILKESLVGVKSF